MKTMVSETSVGEVEHLKTWAYMKSNARYCENFKSGEIYISSYGKQTMTFWCANGRWRVSTSYCVPMIPVVELGEMQLRLLLIKTPEEILTWCQKQRK